MNIKKILVIINPISGYSRSRELPGALKTRLEGEGFMVDLHRTSGPGDGGQYAHVCARKYDLVLVCGGDGTIREVADGLCGSFVPITIFTAGTENLFAKEMGIVADLNQLVQTIKWGKSICLDMGQVNERKYLLLSGVGFDAEVLLHMNKFRTGNITHLTYFWPIWRTFWEHRFPSMTVQADGEVLIENRRGLVFVTNISRYAVGLRICKNAIYNDGLLDVCIYLCDHQIPLLGHAWRTTRGKHLSHPNVIYHQARNVKVTSTMNVPFETDGDPAGFLPAEYSVIPSALNVLIPPG
jgi:diacylglycerol kinase (ATP)